jgi:hypothetical protein
VREYHCWILNSTFRESTRDPSSFPVVYNSKGIQRNLVNFLVRGGPQAAGTEWKKHFTPSRMQFQESFYSKSKTRLTIIQDGLPCCFLLLILINLSSKTKKSLTHFACTCIMFIAFTCIMFTVLILAHVVNANVNK